MDEKVKAVTTICRDGCLIDLQDIGEINVGGFTYTIACDEETDKYLIQNGLQAEHDQFSMSIKISGALSPQSKAQSLLHEIAHAIALVYGVHDIGENGIDSISQGWFQVIRANPYVIQYVQEVV